MKDIIEKLEPIPDYDFSDLKESDIVMSFDPHVIKEIVQQRNEMLEALIDDIKRALSNWENNYEGGGDWETECLKANIRKIKLIEKACYPKSWEEIKDIFNE